MSSNVAFSARQPYHSSFESNCYKIPRATPSGRGVASLNQVGVLRGHKKQGPNPAASELFLSPSENFLKDALLWTCDIGKAVSWLLNDDTEAAGVPLIDGPRAG